MKYMGGKSQIAKYILPIILNQRKTGQWYVEPFCGGCNVIDKVYGNQIRKKEDSLFFLATDDKRLAADKNKYLIELFKGIMRGQRGIFPISKEEYNKARDDFYNDKNNFYSVFDIAWIGYIASYNGRFFNGGYSNNCFERDFHKEAINNILSQTELLKGVSFVCSDYKDLVLPEASLIYCDPPYKETKEYEVSNFDHDEFWNWCREKKKEGHQIFISERTAPKDFDCVFEIQRKATIDFKQGKIYSEKLFTLN